MVDEVGDEPIDPLIKPIIDKYNAIDEQEWQQHMRDVVDVVRGLIDGSLKGR